jgi:hypothetical protein
MCVKDFLNENSVMIAPESNQSSYSLVLVEHGLDSHGYNPAHKYPPVYGYKFQWGIITEYRIDNLIIWNFHFLKLLEKLDSIGKTSDDMVMTCLAYFDMDYWLGGHSFWGGEFGKWPGGSSIWQRCGKKPEIQVCRHKLPSYVEFFHGTETDSLSTQCKINDPRLRKWIGEVFLTKILDEMLQRVWESLQRYEEN